MKRSACAVMVLAATIGLAGTACSKSDSGTKTADSPTTAASSSTAATSTVDSKQLPSLVPAPANTQTTMGPDAIADNGMHWRFAVNGVPTDVMKAYTAALEGKGWAVSTIITSGGGGGGGGTYTGTNGTAYGVFDGGGYQDKTWIDVCAWPTKPANPSCQRGGE